MTPKPAPQEATPAALATLTALQAEVASLQREAATARADLAAVQADLAQADALLGGHRMQQLLQANEQLMLEAARSRHVAESAVQRVSELTRTSELDGLTGLPNRLLLFDRLAQALTHARRNDHRLALMFLDLDGFKQVNDTLGHKVGDAVLCAVGQRLNDCVRQVDTVCRMGGDEFVLLLPEINNATDSALVAQKLLAALAQLTHVDGLPIRVSASIGISVFPDDASDLEALVDCADRAMYHCKRSGGNCHYFFSACDPLEADTQPALSEPPPAHRRILIVDDDYRAADALALLLRLYGHEVCVATHPVTALQMVATMAPDIVLLDIGLPEINGHELARRIRTQYPALRVTLVAVTGWGRTEDREASAQAGLFAHLVKPVQIEELERVVATAPMARRGA